jgi:hypothetical protein
MTLRLSSFLLEYEVDVEMDVNTGSVIHIDANNIANARTASRLIITNSELIDEVIDVGRAITQSNVVVNMRHSGNSYCERTTMHTVDVTNGELVDNIIEFLEIQGSSINITAYDSANIFTVSSKTYILRSRHALLLAAYVFFPFLSISHQIV